MLPKRVIPCLDVDNGRVVKGVKFSDMQDMGDPVAWARHYETAGADELVFLDISATAEARSPTPEMVKNTAAQLFIPFTVGGGIRNENDAQQLLDAGADRVAVNSAGLREPSLLDKLAARFGRSCLVVAMDVKRVDNDWEVYAAAGQIPTGRKALEWGREAASRGAGEILLTSIDRDGTQQGYDLAVTELLTAELSVPVIASGGAGRLEHYAEATGQAGAAAVLAASQFHSGQTSIAGVKTRLSEQGVPVRPIRDAAVIDPIEAPGPLIGVVDYGVGNRYSLQQALRHIGARAPLTDEPGELAGADGLVLPGVGAFQTAMDRLDERGLTATVQKLVGMGKPLLGICLGEQLLFEGSDEDGWRPGLGLLPGRVVEIETPIRPNIGWRAVKPWQSDPLLERLHEDEYFYHLHQYAATGIEEADGLAYTALPYEDDTDYRVPSIVRRGNVRGTQFHPEKSGAAGLRLLKNFAELCLSAKTSLQ